MARVVLARRARRDLLDLDWQLLDAVEASLGLLEREPLAGHALRGRLRGLRSLRVGTYRVIYQVTDSGETVRVAAIRHRSIAYGADPRLPPPLRTPSSGRRNPAPDPAPRWAHLAASHD